MEKRVTVYDESEGWAWVQLARDAYVGYLPLATLGAPIAADPSRGRAAHPRLSGPGIKLPPRMALSLGARLAIVRLRRRFRGDARTVCMIWARHLAESARIEADFVAVAERFLETPYLWGGRTSEGIDCSGLVQTALTAAGIAAPRDSDMMEAALGEPVAVEDPAPLARGDLVFWKGHVGIMRDARTLLHANGLHMKVVSEPLAAARDRIAASGGGA